MIWFRFHVSKDALWRSDIRPLVEVGWMLCRAVRRPLQTAGPEPNRPSMMAQVVRGQRGETDFHSRIVLLGGAN